MFFLFWALRTSVSFAKKKEQQMKEHVLSLLQRRNNNRCSFSLARFPQTLLDNRLYERKLQGSFAENDL